MLLRVVMRMYKGFFVCARIIIHSHTNTQNMCVLSRNTAMHV